MADQATALLQLQAYMRQACWAARCLHVRQSVVVPVFDINQAFRWTAAGELCRVLLWGCGEPAGGQLSWPANAFEVWSPYLRELTCRWLWLARRSTLPLAATQPAQCVYLPATAAPSACGHLTGGSACRAPAPWRPSLIQVSLPDWSGE